MTSDQPLLDVRGLATQIRRTNGDLVKAVDGLSYRVDAGKALAIVGESGSGKSIGVRTLLRLLPPAAEITAGEVRFDGSDLLRLSPSALRKVRGAQISMIFQNALGSMNPTRTIEKQMLEPLLWHGVCSRSEAKERAIRALGEVGIRQPDKTIRMYPFQLSGGMQQRAMIAMATVTRPRLLIADEPTTALDVTVQRQVLDVLKGLKHAGTAIILITHDLGVARYFCDDVVVMYAGRAVEYGPMGAFLDGPRHPYSRGLLGSTLLIGDHRARLTPIPGNPPDLARIPPGCSFQDRCPEFDGASCLAEQSVVPIAVDRGVACWREMRSA
jgi:oligopeptide/dipeptide ABC transporter ATP-binding protein